MTNEKYFAILIFSLSTFWFYMAGIDLYYDPNNLFSVSNLTIHNFLLPSSSIPAIWFIILASITLGVAVFYYYWYSRPKKPELYDNKGNNLYNNKQSKPGVEHE